MTAQTSSNKNFPDVDIIREHGFLDELNLPPKVIAAIRKNDKQLKVGGIVIILTILAWVFFDYYSTAKHNEAASQLAIALQESSIDSRVQALDKVHDKYNGSTAARWSSLELANIDYEAGKYEEATKKYEEVLDALPSDSPLLPLVQYSIAYSYENLRNYDKALDYYKLLIKYPGLTAEGYQGMGRIYELKNEPAKAGKVYEEFLASLTADASVSPASPVKARIEEKLAQLKAEEGTANK